MARHFQYCSVSGHPYATPFPVPYITLPAKCASVLFYSAALCATNLRTPAGPTRPKFHVGLENGIERIPLLCEEGNVSRFRHCGRSMERHRPPLQTTSRAEPRAGIGPRQRRLQRDIPVFFRGIGIALGIEHA